MKSFFTIFLLIFLQEFSYKIIFASKLKKRVQENLGLAK